MRTIGIYGGTFNPIHNGHVNLAKAICEAGLVDEIWFLVSPLNPLKQNRQQELLPDATRLHLVQLATANDPQLRPSDFEFHLPRPSYTIHTLNQLHATYPTFQFSIIIGQDNWQNFHRWYQADTILFTHTIIVYNRPESTLRTPLSDGTITVHRPTQPPVTFPNQPSFPISSTDIRQAIRQQDYGFASQWLHPHVFHYIQQQKLFM